ncbi:DoxX family protein [Massilia terrae]|uniref:DoxX family protein n=1 Tax=Massilia terrae TaxID=1811224 RepID=A0ABT2CU51_9BURK|nr:DoxX family protein [Massilia terrae]MCS0657502.1 DoxX family protein [Massilia terrae]
MERVLELGARILMAQIFLVSGFGKISGYAGVQQYMEAAHVPGILAPLVIAVELGGGIALLLGFWTRWVALALCGFTLAAAFLFHLHPGDQGQMINFMKNLAMAGGLLMFVKYGAGTPSIDRARS